MKCSLKVAIITQNKCLLLFFRKVPETTKKHLFPALPAHQKDSFILILVQSFSFSFEKIKRTADKTGSKRGVVRSRQLGSGWGGMLGGGGLRY